MHRIAALLAAIVVIVSCDSAMPTDPLGRTGGGAKNTGGSNRPDATKPTVALDSPTAGKNVNVGDSILVVMRLHDNVALRSVVLEGLTLKGSLDLGTLTVTPRYQAITAPASGQFRPGLRDTIIRRYLKPTVPVDETRDSLVIRAIVTDSSGNVDSAKVRVNMIPNGAIAVRPTAEFDAPPTGTPVRVGDSILVQVHIRDNIPLDRVLIGGYTMKGSAALGTLTLKERYGQLNAPGAETKFRPGLKDTVIRRYLQPTVPIDTTLDSLVLRAVVIDSAGKADTAFRRVNVVAQPTVAVRPTVQVDTPSTGALINVGDSILVVAHLSDNVPLSRVTIQGLTVKGSVDLGTLTETPRYAPITAPISGDFRPGLKDTIIRRYLRPIAPIDTSVDSLVIRVVLTDSAKKADTLNRRVNIVSGPKVTLLTPQPTDSIPAGIAMTVSARATHPDGVSRVSIRVTGELTWPTRLDTTVTQTYPQNSRDVTFTTTIPVPADAPVAGRITVSATAFDFNRQPGAAPPTVAFIRSAASIAPPHVMHTVSSRVELMDTLVIAATGQGIRAVGFIVRDSVGRLLKRDSVLLNAPLTANVQVPLGLNLTNEFQGKRLAISSFAVDQAGRTGYSVRTLTAAAQPDLAAASTDSVTVVYGRTYRLLRPGTIADIAVDVQRGNVFLSNINYNRLEVWQNNTKAYDQLGVAVGSLPWGMVVSNNPDTLLVANSGGTNISRVFIGSSDPRSIKEDLANRILTRNTYVWTAKQTIGSLSKLHWITSVFSYSDRPQYVQQAATGRIFFSTRPTQFATPGTIRYIDPDPRYAAPDPIQVHGYAEGLSTSDIIWSLFNIDSIVVLGTADSDPTPETVLVYDHPVGQKTGVIVGRGTDIVGAATDARNKGSDVEVVYRLDVGSLNLTDTTFVATSGNRNWIAFGEGNTKDPRRAGRIMMVNDPLPKAGVPPFFSPSVTVSDLMENASERVFGIAIDSTGTMVGSHGFESYVSTIDEPFHLRLQGKYNSFDNGAGIVFHPRAKDPLKFTTRDDERLMFVATSNGVIEIVDDAYFVNRGRLQLKNGIYGPLRASLPLPGDPAGVVLKLFALSQDGLVVIDLRAEDIKPVP